MRIGLVICRPYVPKNMKLTRLQMFSLLDVQLHVDALEGMGGGV